MKPMRYRAIDARDPKGETWVYGQYVQHQKRVLLPIDVSNDDFIANTEHLIMRDGFADWSMPRPLEAVPVLPDSVQMSTGIKDDREIEIFTDDILKIGDYYGIVKFGEYEQDGSSGEYGTKTCKGFYLDVSHEYEWGRAERISEYDYDSYRSIVGTEYEKKAIILGSSYRIGARK